MTTPAEFDRLLDQYAEVTVRVGLNIQPGQRLWVIGAPLEAVAFVRRVTTHAYRAGAPLVNVLWNDPLLGLIRLQEAPRDSFDEFADWLVAADLAAVQRGDAVLSIHAADPDLLVGQDPTLLAQIRQIGAEKWKATQVLLSKNATTWLVVSVPIPGWNAKVFPKLPAEAREAAMWEAIFRMSRVDGADPVADWKAHGDNLNARRDTLNAKRYAALHYTAPGTDLTIGLPDGHRWQGGGAVDSHGIAFVPNIPTEEVFTMPHKDRVNGVLTNSRPISIPGVLIDGFTLTFENGLIVKATAQSGEADLERLLDMDAGARRIGEVALVPNSSPIAQSGELFYNGLYDENAACHIALGNAYPFTIDGGETLTPDELAAAGANSSMLHLDFMIGSAHMNIDGIRADGSTEPVMRAGEWAF